MKQEPTSSFFRIEALDLMDLVVQQWQFERAWACACVSGLPHHSPKKQSVLTMSRSSDANSATVLLIAGAKNLFIYRLL